MLYLYSVLYGVAIAKLVHRDILSGAMSVRTSLTATNLE